jgi:hypothetical protein
MKHQLNRRGFVRVSASGLVAATGLLPATAYSAPKDTEFGKRFIHHVFFWLKQPVTPEVKARFEKALKDLVKIETIVDSHLGVPASTSREVIDASYTYSLLTTCKSKADQDAYQVHPTHLKFVADCKDLWEKVVVYDSVSI